MSLAPSRSILMMCGLPAAGKTTVATRLHAHVGGVLIRSCDVYADLGIRLQDWVVRTRGFTVNVHEYDHVRDDAYAEIVRRLETSIERSDVVILDAVYGERVKRANVYAVCGAHGLDVTLLHCRCDDSDEVARRFDRRRGRENTPEHEASDVSIFRDIARRWQDPHGDRLLDGSAPTIVTVDTSSAPPVVSGKETPWLTAMLRTALTTPALRAGE
jgi:predicted kinase